MQPGARIQSAIELVAEIENGRGAADRTVADYFRSRRYAGSGDRSAIAEFVYGVLRRRAELVWRLDRAGAAPLMADDGGAGTARLLMIAELALGERGGATEIAARFDGARFSPPALDAAERALLTALTRASGADGEEEMPDWVRGNYPQWLDPALRSRFGAALGPELAALNGRAPVDLRVNRLKADREEALAALSGEGVAAAPCPLSPLGIRLVRRAPVRATPPYRRGWIEVQDEGSQLVALLTGARPGMQVIDLCAGAGGKTLALAAAMENRGQIYACDRDRRRLLRMAPRIRRAGVRNVQVHRVGERGDALLGALAGQADRVLLDAPCSGSGVWRRNPEAKWRLDAAMLDRYQEAQRRLLASAAPLVREGGYLVYATCSVLECENEAQIHRFVERTPGYRLVPVAEVWRRTLPGSCPAAAETLLLSPHRHGVDGFFVAILERAGA